MDKTAVDFKKMYYGFPVILISYCDEDGIPNIASISSSFTLGNMVCLGFGTGGHAIETIKRTKDFVINLPDRSLMREIEICGYTSGREYHKFELTGLTPVMSEHIKAPLIKECKAAIECRLQQVLTYPSAASSTGYTVALADIVGRQISTSLLTDDGRFISDDFDPVLFLGDHHQRTYRYLAADRCDPAGSFLPKNLHV